MEQTGTLKDEHAAHGDIVTIDFTPPGCKTPEGNARVAKAIDDFNGAAHEVANVANQLAQFKAEIKGALSTAGYFEAIAEFDALLEEIEKRREKQKAFLRAVAGE